MIATRNLNKSFGSIKPVRNVTLTVGDANSLCVLGRSGCGKTTLLKIMGGILTPDDGEIIVNRAAMTRLKTSKLDEYRSMIGYSFQEPLLLPYLTALENVTTVLSPLVSTTTTNVETKTRKIFSRLGLSNRLTHYPSKLSVGEKKRVDIARAIVKDPSILIADEPFSNLDPATSRMVMEIFREFLNNGATLVYSTTNPSDCKFADETYKMS